MKILQINKFYYLKGGAERYFFDLQRLLQEKGHQVIPFAMKNERNVDTPYKQYFVSQIDIEKPRFSFRSAGRIIYSFEAKRKIKELVAKERPDIAHIHNIYHQISPSILTVLKKHEIPIIMTIHDFKLICPAYILYSKNEICQRCKTYRYYNCFFRKCVKNSFWASLLNALEMYFHKFLKIYESNIDLFIAPSNFVRNKILEFKIIAPEKIIVLPHFIDLENIQQQYQSKNYFLYFGRLSKEKGVKVLLKAMKFIKQSELWIAGSGPQEEELKEFVWKNKLSNVRFLGYLGREELQSVIQNSLFSVIPSLVYETFGMTVLESFVFSKPVIVSDLGALSELVEEEKTGLKFKPGNFNQLAQKINFLLKNPRARKEMGERAREKVEEFNKEKYYKELMSLYKKVISRK